MKIQSAIENYFHAFQDINSFNKNTTFKEGFIAVISFASYFTLVIPGALGIIYGLTKLKDRVSKQKSTPQTETINDVYQKAINNKRNPQLAEVKSYDSRTSSLCDAPILGEPIEVQSFDNLTQIHPDAYKRMKERWDKYRDVLEKNEKLLSSDNVLASIVLEPLGFESNRGCISADGSLVNEVLGFEDHPTAYFIPSTYFINGGDEQLTFLDKSVAQQDLISQISDAFLLGKDVIVGRYGNDVHAITFACNQDGHFKIIDSFTHGTVDINKLESALNAAKIKDSNGKAIHFQGEYVTTRLQIGGNHCQRFATMYAIRIAQTGDIDSYKEVNGAFLEGRMKSYEDLKTIDGKTRIATMPEDWSQNGYRSFMLSWGMRLLGLPQNDWREVSAGILIKSPEGDPSPISFMEFKKGYFPNCTWVDRDLLYLQTPDDHFIELTVNAMLPDSIAQVPIDFDKQSVGELYPTGEDPLICIYDKESKRSINFHLPQGYKIATPNDSEHTSFSAIREHPRDTEPKVSR